MAQTRFSGPVLSDNGFATSGTISATVLTATSATINNIRFSNGNATSGLVSAQLGYIPVLVGATTAYIALFRSFTL